MREDGRCSGSSLHPLHVLHAALPFRVYRRHIQLGTGTRVPVPVPLAGDSTLAKMIRLRIEMRGDFLDQSLELATLVP
jgi:hypothetical protein